MDRIKRILAFLKKPNKIFLSILTVIATAGFVAFAVLLARYGEKTAIMSAFGGFGILFIYCVVQIAVLAIGAYRNGVKQKLQQNRYFGFLYNYTFRTVLFALCSAVVNVGFVAVNVVSAFLYQTFWYGALAIYYGLLIVFRVGAILGERSAKKRFGSSADYRKASLKIYLGSGIVLAVTNLSMIGAIAQMMSAGRTTPDGMVFPILTATYTFWKMSLAIYNIVKARRYDNYMIQSLRNLNLSNACISMVSLTVLLVGVFGDGGMMGMKMAVGLGACVLTFLLALNMIVKASVRLRRREYERGEIPEPADEEK